MKQRKVDEGELLLTIKEAAKFLSISLPTLSAWTKDGLLTAYRLGGRVYYKKSEILDALKPIITTHPPLTKPYTPQSFPPLS